jgi:hypothetical protein
MDVFQPVNVGFGYTLDARAFVPAVASDVRGVASAV